MVDTSAHLNRRAFTGRLSALALGAVALPAAWARTPSSSPSPATIAAPAPATRPIPAELGAFPAAAPWSLQGQGVLRFFGFKAYDAYLWTAAPSPNPLQSNSLFALEIDYATSIKADDIANVSLVEMARLRPLSNAQVSAWTPLLRKAFPDVKAGDRLTGVSVPGVGTRFFFNGRLTSEINETAFGDAFFAIWLDEKTKRPELRRALLGAARR